MIESMALEQLKSDLVTLGGAGVCVVDIGDDQTPDRFEKPGIIRVGVHRSGGLPRDGLDAFDTVLSVDPAAPQPWVSIAPECLDIVLSDLCDRVARQPVASAVAAQVLRMTVQLSLEQALLLESLAYSLLLASEGFKTWRHMTPARVLPDDAEPRLLSRRNGSVLELQLNRPLVRNAFDARMRDELVEALEFALLDAGCGIVELSGSGKVFCAGGDLNEFGNAFDPGCAHLIRTLRAPALLIHELRTRMRVHVHGACIGAGIEIPAAAGRVVAHPGTFFRLPEVSMGLIPGAGGTATIPRRIGRHRTFFMAVTGADIDLETALAWGLIDAVKPKA